MSNVFSGRFGFNPFGQRRAKEHGRGKARIRSILGFGLVPKPPKRFLDLLSSFVPKTANTSSEHRIAALHKANCIRCWACYGSCPEGAIALGDAPIIVLDACTGCGICVDGCPTGALSLVHKAEKES